MKKQWTDMLQKLNKPQYILVMTGVTGLIIIFFGYFYMLQPVNQETKRSLQDMESLKSQIEILENMPPRKELAADEMLHLFRQIPVKYELSDFIKQLQHIENRSDVLITDLSVGELNPNNTSKEQQNSGKEQQNSSSESNNSIESHELLIYLTGTYEQILNFMSELHHIERLASVSSWSIDMSQTERLEALLTVHIYTSETYTELYNAVSQEKAAILISPYKDRNPGLSDQQFIEQIKRDR